MKVEEFFKCFVVHFAITHSVLLIFHFTVGLKCIVPAIERHIDNVSFQYAYLLPHDFVMTFMLIFFLDMNVQEVGEDLWNFFGPTVVFTLGANFISEARVLFYFYDFPSTVAFSMFAVRTVVHMLSNLLVVYMYLQ